MTSSDVRKSAQKEAAKKRPQTWKKGQSGNIKGGPKRGGSMAEAYDWALSLTPDAVAEVLSINGSNDLARQYKQMPRGIQLKLLVALRVVAALMFEPQAAMMNHIVDRLDGTLTQQAEHSGKVEIIVSYENENRDNSPDVDADAKDNQA